MRTSEADRASDGFPRGLAFGIVTDNEDPERLGRVRVKLELHGDGQSSFWARVATPMAGPEMGLYALPEIDDEVLVGFIAEDASHPVVLGGVWNGQRVPPETNDGNNDRRLWRSRSGHELRFDDGQNPEIELLLKDGPRVYLTPDTALMEDANGNKVEIAASGTITIEASAEIKLSAPQVKIDASGSAEMKASGNCKIQGAIVEIN
ncbi:phage tail protein [Rhodobacterales bacterium HKCCE3408]|nr:phage tail protein [Rhodobacterales bacterium HKCCE3408]